MKFKDVKVSEVFEFRSRKFIKISLSKGGNAVELDRMQKCYFTDEMNVRTGNEK